MLVSGNALNRSRRLAPFDRDGRNGIIILLTRILRWTTPLNCDGPRTKRLLACVELTIQPLDLVVRPPDVCLQRHRCPHAPPATGGRRGRVQSKALRSPAETARPWP